MRQPEGAMVHGRDLQSNSKEDKGISGGGRMMVDCKDPQRYPVGWLWLKDELRNHGENHLIAKFRRDATRVCSWQLTTDRDSLGDSLGVTGRRSLETVSSQRS